MKNDQTPGRQRWIEGGRDLLRSTGPASVKLHRLTEQVGLSTGSFYHHFESFPKYLEGLAGDFSGPGLSDAMESAEHPDPRERLERFLRIHRAREVDDLYSAMRAWGRSFPPASQAVKEAEITVVRYLKKIFEELGSDRTTARAQATLMLALGTSRLETPWPWSAAEGQRTLELILGEAPGSRGLGDGTTS